jgi:hypothetical protein
MPFRNPTSPAPNSIVRPNQNSVDELCSQSGNLSVRPSRWRLSLGGMPLPQPEQFRSCPRTLIVSSATWLKQSHRYTEADPAVAPGPKPNAASNQRVCRTARRRRNSKSSISAESTVYKYHRQHIVLFVILVIVFHMRRTDRLIEGGIRQVPWSRDGWMTRLKAWAWLSGYTGRVQVRSGRTKRECQRRLAGIGEMMRRPVAVSARLVRGRSSPRGSVFQSSCLMEPTSTSRLSGRNVRGRESACRDASRPDSWIGRCLAR